ncbi:MAG: ferrous iron transport protein B [Anaerolineae bacterium]|nr:ferrous iron transport protein B [Anaerolineae bacterium]MDW8068394.1 ferrous iron transport protein B [Anaerolineae bacterium]
MSAHAIPETEVSSRLRERSILVALAGQPNVGKSTLFNRLTGLHQHVGNWPGKTVERKEGHFTCNGVSYRLVDLPGTYSLTANSPEELIAREFILRERPDVVVAVVDAATLERSLYLVAELLPLPVPVVVALNMMDVARQEGIYVEPEVLQAALGVPVVPMSATRGIGVPELVETVERLARGELPYAPRLPRIRPDHQEVLDTIGEHIARYVPAPYPRDWVALKLLEGDPEVTRMMQGTMPPEQWEKVYALLRAHDDAQVAVASGRYEWIGRMVRAAVTRPRLGQIGLTERLDRWATHPFWGLVILAGVLGLVFWLTYTVGTPLQDGLEVYVIGALAERARSLFIGMPAWFSNLLADGMIGGVGAVLTFLPILVIFFAAMAFLEDVGYMARAAYVMDSLMHRIGLHGKSFLPLFLGFGCNVPAILGTRVIESRQARLLTILLAPLVPCTARMAVVAFLAPAFFGPAALLVSWGLILTPILILALTGAVINSLLFRGQRSAFIMELPLYHLPNWRTIGLSLWHRSLSFVRKAGTVILAVSVVVWGLSAFPGENVEESYLARIGQWLEPLGRGAGLDWRLTVALLSSFIAKENSIATLGVLFRAGEESLADLLAATYSPVVALAYLVVQTLFIPCVATVGVVHQETASWRWTLFSVGLLLVISLAAGMLVFQVGTWIAGL